MCDCKIIKLIKFIGPEFEEIEDEMLGMWVELVKPLVSKKMFGKLYEQAVAYLVCHKLKMAGKGINPLGEEFSLANLGFGIASVSEGGSSISFGANQGSNLTTDAELALTIYGLEFLAIRRSVIVPIHCDGERTL